MCQPGTHDPDLHNRLREGLKRDLLGERWNAIVALEGLLEEHPSYSEARGHLAWIYTLQGNNPSAIEHLKALVRADPSNTDAAQRIAELERESNRFASGEIGQEEGYHRAVELAEDASRTARSQQREALVLLRSLWEGFDYRDSSVWVSRISQVFQDFSTCLRATEACLERQPRNVEFLTRLGLIHEFMDQTREAATVYREVLRERPPAWGILANLVSLGEESPDRVPADSPIASLFLETKREVHPPKQPGLFSFFRRGRTPRDRAVRRAKDLNGDSGFQDLPCNLCGVRTFEGVAVGRENSWPIMRCGECGLIQTHPQPTQETLTRKYQEEYYGEGALETARGIHEGPPIGGEPMTMLPRVMDFLVAQGLKDYEDSLTQKRMLDVGCGEGVLMRDFRIRGWDCEGTEVSSPAIGFLREKGYGIHEGVLEELSLPGEQYHLITLSHVIEHVRDPLGDLKRIHSLLASGGWLFVTTPGADSLPSKIAGEDWFYDPDHIFFFSRSTLERTMEAAGFEVFGDASYVGVGRETWEEAWLREGLGPSVKQRIEERNEGDVLLMVGRKG